MAGSINTPLGAELDIGTGHMVLDVVPAVRETAKGAQRPLFSAHVYCGGGRPSQLLLSSCKMYYKSSAVAELGDRGHNRHGRKEGELLCLVRGSWDPV